MIVNDELSVTCHATLLKFLNFFKIYFYFLYSGGYYKVLVLVEFF